MDTDMDEQTVPRFILMANLSTPDTQQLKQNDGANKAK